MLISPKHLLDASKLASRLLWLRAQQSSLESDDLGVIGLAELAVRIESRDDPSGDGPLALDVLFAYLKRDIARRIDETAEAMKRAGVDPDAEWPHRGD